MKNAPITPEELLADGWIKGDDPVESLFKKAIPNRNPINSTPEDSDIKLVVHGMYNVWRFAVLLPNGGLLNFVANTIEEVKAFENALDFYDPPF